VYTVQKVQFITENGGLWLEKIQLPVILRVQILIVLREAAVSV